MGGTGSGDFGLGFTRFRGPRQVGTKFVWELPCPRKFYLLHLEATEKSRRFQGPQKQSFLKKTGERRSGRLFACQKHASVFPQHGGGAGDKSAELGDSKKLTISGVKKKVNKKLFLKNTPGPHQFLFKCLAWFLFAGGGGFRLQTYGAPKAPNSDSICQGFPQPSVLVGAQCSWVLNSNGTGGGPVGGLH